MERVNLLIEKLAEQKRNNVTASQLLITVQLLQNELLILQNITRSLGTSKVAVTMPVNAGLYPNTFEEKKPEIQIDALRKEEKTAAQEAKREKTENQPFFVPKPLISEQKENKELKPASTQPGLREVPFNAMAETPTLLHQQQQKEIHETIGGMQESLNDKLKQEKKEVAHALKGSPVKDLRKAIGINDRFLFVQELFRGDDAMYERSIKTINSFHILQEAEYWINRELKVKLGWNDSKDVVQHFYQVVRRRFLSM
ncbi:MAG: hypothetical protein ABR502_07110 [Chitinophagaceae bacterium]